MPLTITDVASRLGVHPNTVRTMIARGDLSAVHVGIAHAKRRTLRILESELESFTRSRSQTPEPKRQPRLSAKRRAFRAKYMEVKIGAAAGTPPSCASSAGSGSGPVNSEVGR